MEQIKVDKVNISPLNFPVRGMVAIANVKYAGLILGSIAIYELRDGSGYRITYPTKKAGRHNSNVYNPYNKEVSQAIEKAIISAYIRDYDKNKVKQYGPNNSRSTTK